MWHAIPWRWPTAAVEFGSALMWPWRRGTRENLFRLDGDLQHVPARQQTAAVRGEVNSPRALVASGKKLGAFQSVAAGAMPTGRASAANVIHPNGMIESRTRPLWLVTLDPTPKPGAIVVIPAQERQRQASMMQSITVNTQALTPRATVLFLSRQ